MSSSAYAAAVCRSIKTLRPPYTPEATPSDIEAAARQYIRKVAGMREPSARNREAFEAAVAAVAATTQTLLGEVTVRSTRETPGMG